MPMKPSQKQPNLGTLPVDWHRIAFKDFVSLQRGHDLTWRDRKEGKVPVMGSAGQNGFHNVAIAKGPGVTIGRSGASFGEAQFCKEDFWPHNTALYVIDFRGNDPLFVFYILSQFDFSRYNSGGAQQSLNRNFIASILVSIPQPSEQRAIAAALSDVDTLLGGLDRLIAKKRDLKQAAMQQLLTGQSRLPGFSGEWEVKRLGQISEIAIGRTPPRLNPIFWGEGFVWLSIADLHSKVVSSSKEQVTKAAAETMQLIPKGTLLMSFKLSIGRLCFAGCDLFTNEAICSFSDLKASANYLYYALGRIDFSLYGKQAVKGYTLNKESLKAVQVLMPPITEQDAIATVLSDMDAELEALEQRRAKTLALKQAMMQELLTGRTRLI